MPLQSGTILGPYEVTAKIGEGGMGEVWQARDTKLDRDVALKVLPEAFTSDPDRLARFEREAKVLASLNHPNIGSIYGLEEAEGVRALVLELVEGPTLADRIKQGPIPLDEALPIAKQIAEALEAAHERGVIHRDLKPANIKVKDDGTVKVLDFGLAKAFQPDASDPSMSASPTISLTAAATQMGMVIGTAAYMSPEQARGKPVDKRTDIWAFGVVLYEMLTGARPFQGEDVSLTLASVMKSDLNVTRLPDDVPATVRTVVRRCLQKDPHTRLRDIGDVRLAMEGVFETTSSTPATLVAGLRLRLWQRPVSAAALAVLLAVSSGVAVWTLLAGRATSPPVATSRFTITLPGTDQIPGGGGTRVVLSPDGRTLVYVATRDGVSQLFQRPIEQFEARPMMGTEGGRDPFFSLDGQWVGFIADEVLQKVALAGGPAQALTTWPRISLRGAHWEADDTILLGRAPGLARVPAAGGEFTIVAEPEDQGELWYPPVLAESGAILFTSTTGPVAGQLQVLVPETGERRTVLPNAVAGRVLETGHLIFVRSGAIWAVPFDRRLLEIVGTPAPVVEGVRVEGGGAVQYAVADNGSLVYIPGAAIDVGSRRLVWIDRDGGEEALPLPAADYLTLSLSPDGSRAAIEINDDVWVSDLSRGALTLLTTDEGRDANPRWSHDGTREVFESERNGRLELFWRVADSSAPAEVLLTPDERWDRIVPGNWSPDGATLFLSTTAETDRDVGMVSIDGSGTWEPLIQTPADEWAPAISPDGRWLAYTSDETGRPEIYVQRFPELEGRVPISVGGGSHPTWSSDGREVVYLRTPSGPADAVMRVALDFDDGQPPSVTAGTPDQLFDWPYFFARGGRWHHDVSSDGQRLLVIARANLASSPGRAEINVVLNWTQELLERVPIP